MNAIGRALGAALIALSAIPQVAQASPPDIGMAKLLWHIRHETDAGNSNDFDSRSVWADSDGNLHLKIAWRDGHWTSAELYTDAKLGFGTYQFQIQGQPNQLNDWAVLSFNNAPTPDIGPELTNEIDVDFTTWGGSQSFHGNWTVWPNSQGPAPATHTYDTSPAGGMSTHRFIWKTDYVTFQAMSGLQDVDDADGMFHSWTYAPSNPKTRIPQNAEHLHIRLWMYDGVPPTDGQQIEVVIKNFEFIEDPMFADAFE